MNAVSTATPMLLAHQGGWDEVLLIAGPILVIMGLLWLAKRRVDHAAAIHGPGGGRHPADDPTDSN